MFSSTSLPLSTISFGLNPSPKGYLLPSGLGEIFSFSVDVIQFVGNNLHPLTRESNFITHPEQPIQFRNQSLCGARSNLTIISKSYKSLERIDIANEIASFLAKTQRTYIQISTALRSLLTSRYTLSNQSNSAIIVLARYEATSLS